MNNHLIFSFIVPFYNRYNKLIRCINSVLQNDNHDTEIVLIDDCSTEKGIEKLHKYIKDKNITYKRLIKNKGPGIARSYGINFAKGDWIFFLDSDDEINSDVLPQIRRILQKQKKIDSIFFSKFSRIDNGATNIVHTSEINIISSILKSYMWHIDLCRKIKNTTISQYYNEDACLGGLLLAQCKKSITLDCIFYKYYAYKDSLVGSLFSQENLNKFAQANNSSDKFYEQRIEPYLTKKQINYFQSYLTEVYFGAFAILYKSNLKLSKNITNKLHFFAQNITKEIPKFKDKIYLSPCSGINCGLLLYLQNLLPKCEFSLLDNNPNANSRSINFAKKMKFSIGATMEFESKRRDFVLIYGIHSKAIEAQFIEKGLKRKRDYIVV